MASQLYALLVGVDRYDNPAQAPHLRGCVADVEGTYNWLTQQMQIPADNVLLLTSRMEQNEPPDRRATRANILRGWQTHLMQAGPGDQVFFNYSGHGARARSIDPENASGYDETMVPCDSRTPNIYDILDTEVAQLIEAVEKKGAQVTVFLDCCHSGSGTRALESTDENTPMVRKCSSDERVRPLDTLLLGAVPRTGTRSAKAPSGWIPLGQHVLLAGCRDEELSHEYRAPETGQWQGATTYFFHKAMANFRPEMTWSDVHDFVQTQVHKVYPAQSPQLEGPSDMAIFGGITQARQPYYLVAAVDGEHFIMLNVGVTAGLSVGSQLAIYPPESDLTGTPIATATIDEVKVDQAWAKLDSPTTLALASRVKVTGYGYEDQTLVVGVADDPLRQALEKVGSGFLKFVGTDAMVALAQYRVGQSNEQYVITDAAELQVVNEMPPATDDGTSQVIKLLEHLAVYNNVATLQNPSSASRMTGMVTIENPVTYTQFGRRGPIDPTPSRSGASGNQAMIQSGEAVHFTIKNSSSSPVYLAVLEFTPEFAINRIYPPRARYQQVGAKKEIEIDFPSLTLDDPKLAKGRYLYKVLATAEPTEFDSLLLPALNEPQVGPSTRAVGSSALAQLMNAVRHDGTRAATLRVDETDDQWTTAQLEITVTATGQATELTEGQTSVSLKTTFIPIMVNKPATMRGTLSIGPANPSTRGGQSGVTPPPGMGNPDASQYFQLMTVGSSTRTTASAPMLLTVEGDAGELDTVTPETPLQLELTVEDDPALRGIIPVAFDGENYYVVGASQEGGSGAVGTRSVGTGRNLTINIDYLPVEGASSDAADSGADNGEGQTRDLKRTARLFFYKVFLKELPTDTGVRRATVSAEGKASYEPVSAATFGTPTKVALMVHGITADTQWLVEQVWPRVMASDGYDLCLAYDYESFATGISDNGRILHETLTSLGFGANDAIQLDIFAHSMGTLVARALVELWGGEQYVDRVFMGGPPNAGSPLAKLRGYIPWLGTVMVNLMGEIPASMLLSWALNRFNSASTGLADLDPDADFYQAINNPEKAVVSVPYFVQIGNNGQSYEKWNKIFRFGMRLADTGLDQLFGGDHDLAVGVNSARSIQTDKWPNTTVEIIPTNHFGYLYTAQGWPLLERWLKVPLQ